MKTLLIVIDGMAGSARTKTPLENAFKPNLNRLAHYSSVGSMRVIPGVAPESDSAVVTLLGYDASKDYSGRGPLEAIGSNVKFKDGELALRCNFATSSDGVKITDRRAGRTLTNEEANALEKIIKSKVKLKNATFVFKATLQHRAVLVIKAKKKLSSKITNTDPAYSRKKSGVTEALAKFSMKVSESKPLVSEAKQSADLLNEFTKKAFEALNDCPVNNRREKRGLLQANVILCRDAGDSLPNFHSLKKKYKRNWAIIADMPLEIGIGKSAGMTVIPLEAPNFCFHEYRDRVEKTIKALNHFDAVYIHLKGPDLFGHDGDGPGKQKSIEEIDRFFIGPLLAKVNMRNTVIAVTADHATPIHLKAHSADPVPLLIYAPGRRHDHISFFDEKRCLGGSIRIVGKQLMPLLMHFS